MKLEYGSETLGDDTTGDKITDHGGGHARLLQSEPLLGGGAPAHFARGNHTNQRSFTVDKVHADAKAALKWWEAHPDDLPDSGVLRTSESTYAAQMADAVLVAVERLERTGKTTLMKYTFTGGRILDSL